MTRRHLLAASLGTAARSAFAGASRRAPFWDPNKHLLLDRRLAARVVGLKLEPGVVRKEPRNPLFGEDRPWEVRIDNLYGNILYDDEERIYKLWYNPFIIYEKHNKTPRPERPRTDYNRLPKGVTEMGVCYATSGDGLVWEKPELGLVEFEGSKRNNILLRARPKPSLWVPHGAGVWKDLDDPNPERRYKMFFTIPREHLCVSFSRDGIHWQDPIPLETPHVRGDTHNNTFWAPTRNRFVGITRRFDGFRIVTRTESEDFVHWTEGVDVLRRLPSEPARQPYAMIAFPYGNVYLGLLMLLNRGEKFNRENPEDDTVDCELAWSPDTVNWERVCPGSSLIPRGPRGSHDYGCIYACAYPLLRDGVLRLYYGGSNWKHSDWRDGHLCLSYLRPDGFAGLAPLVKDGRGWVETSPVTCTSTSLRVAADAAGGEVRITASTVEGARLDESLPLAGSAAETPVRWRGKGLAGAVGKPVRLRFDVRGARLYSFRFA